jgi:DNA repair protein RecO (recombination protein O)
MPVASHVEQGLLLYKLDYLESDQIVTIFTATLGSVTALARGARNSKKRFSGALEPIHTIHVKLDDRPSSDLMLLKEASISVPRTKIMTRLTALESAGQALKWLRLTLPQRTQEPELFEAIVQLLDSINEHAGSGKEQLLLAEFGLFLLAALGFRVRLTECVVCGKHCEPGRTAYVDALRGGLVCGSCGGASMRLDGALRERLRRAACGSEHVLLLDDAEPALRLVDLSLRAHLGVQQL